MTTNQLVKIEKVSSSNKNLSQPDGYWVEGHLLLLQIGKPLLVFRTKNARGNIVGEFSTSKVKDISHKEDYAEIITANSIYKLTYL